MTTHCGGRGGEDSGAGQSPVVLHVITDLHTGGAENMLTSLVLGSAAGRRPVAVASLMDGGGFARILERAGVTVIGLGLKPEGSGLRSPGALFRLAGLIRRLRPDVIQSWMYHADLFAFLAWILSGRWRRTRLYWGVRCSDMDTREYRLLLRMTIRACALFSHLPTAVIANSVAGRDAHLRLGYRPKQFPVIDNGIDPTRFAAAPETRRSVREKLGVAENLPLIALVARVDPMKDHPGFLAAFDRLQGAEALLIGRGTESLPDRPGLHRLGQRSEVAELLAACDIVVSGSAFGEGFSNALAEGMAAGLAPVATDVGDARRIVGDTGVVVPPGDPGALAGAMQALIDDPERRRALGRSARRRIEEHFSLERAVEAFAAIHAGSGPDRPAPPGDDRRSA